MPRASYREVVEHLKASRHFGATLNSPFFTSAEAALPTVEKLRTILRQRFEQLPYPYSYPLSKKTRETFLEHLKSKGVLDAVLSDYVLEDVRTELGVLHLDYSARALIEMQLSTHQYPAAFHRSVVQAIYQNLKKIQVLIATHGVPKNWTSRYVAAANEQILREMQAIYPQFGLGEPLDLTIKTPKSKEGLIACVRELVSSAMEKAGLERGRKALADQLTSIILSAPELLFLNTQITPEGVRKDVARKTKNRTKKATKTK
jgi:hypothetical protein